MPTEKPRFTITVSDEMLRDIDDFRFEYHYPTRTQAATDLFRIGLEVLKKQNLDTDAATGNIALESLDAVKNKAAEFNNKPAMFGRIIITKLWDAKMIGVHVAEFDELNEPALAFDLINYRSRLMSYGRDKRAFSKVLSNRLIAAELTHIQFYRKRNDMIIEVNTTALGVLLLRGVEPERRIFGKEKLKPRDRIIIRNYKKVPGICVELYFDKDKNDNSKKTAARSDPQWTESGEAWRVY